MLAEKYQLASLLGAGGMGFIYQAEQLGLGRSVAVKLLRPELIDTRLDWFRTEAMAASRINHPHAVAIYDFGITDDGIPYLVMEHIRGRTLSSLIEQEPLSPERVVRLAAQCLSALDEAHACGVIHCDLTADNVIVERLRDGDDFAKVIDFGLARLYDKPDEESQLVGTAEYVSPEQILGQAVTPQTDLYAMGILLYEMIVGRTPFAGGATPVVLQGHLEAKPDAPHHIIPTCPVALGDIIVAALSKDPKSRPADATTMRDQLLSVFPSTESPTIQGARRSRPTPPMVSNVSGAVAPRHSTRLTCVLGRRDSQIIGRRKEVQQIVDFAQGKSPSNMLMILGPHGIGKARLTREATRQAGDSVKVFAGGSDPSGLKLAWYPLLSMLEQVLGLEESPSLEQLGQAAARCGLPGRDLPGLAEAFGIEGPAIELELAVRRREARAAALRTLLSVGRRFADSVLCFADADRYDHPSLEIVRELQKKLPHNVRMILTAEKSLDLGSGPVQRLELAGLPPQHAKELAQSLAGKDYHVPDALAVHNITGGSPAAVEQLVGWIRLGHGTANVPSLLVDLVAIRVNRLPAPARRLLQAVAIHGTVASRALVESTVGPEEKRTLLDLATWTGLLVVGSDSLTIPTDLVANVISACMPADVRRRLHLRALNAYGEDASAGLRAHHAERAREHCNAYDLYVTAGHDSVRRFDDPGAAVWYGKAVACARVLHGEAAEDALAKLAAASVLLAEVLRQSGELGLATGICEEAQGFGPDDQQRSMIHRTLGVIAMSAEKPVRAEEQLKLAIGAALRAGERNFLCQCYLDLICALDAQDKGEEATRELQEAIDVITLGEGLRTTNGPERLWRLGLGLADRVLRQGDLKRARDLAHGVLALVSRAHNSHARGRVSAILAQICDTAGEHSMALRHRANAIDAMRSLGDRRSTAELLIKTAKTTSQSERPESTMRLAHKLAAEIGWEEGVLQSQEDYLQSQDD